MALRADLLSPTLLVAACGPAPPPPAGSNRGRDSNPRFDELVEQEARLADRAARRPLYLEAQRIVAHDLPYLSRFTKVHVAVLLAGRVGYRHSPSGELHSLRTMQWAERERPDRQKTDHEPSDRERIGPP
jgi:ABC-type transport system substrate-binding protein